jgi:hypothetical protein
MANNISEDEALSKFGIKKRSKNAIKIYGRNMTGRMRPGDRRYQDFVKAFYHTPQNYFQAIRNILKAIFYQIEYSSRCQYDVYIDIHDPYHVDTYAWTEYFKTPTAVGQLGINSLEDLQQITNQNENILVFLLKTKRTNIITGYQICEIVEPTELYTILSKKGTLDQFGDPKKIKEQLSDFFGNICVFHGNALVVRGWTKELSVGNIMVGIIQMAMNIIKEELRLTGYASTSIVDNESSFYRTSWISSNRGSKIISNEMDMLLKLAPSTENPQNSMHAFLLAYPGLKLIVEKYNINLIHIWNNRDVTYLNNMNDLMRQLKYCNDENPLQSKKSVDVSYMGLYTENALKKMYTIFGDDIQRFLSSPKKNCFSKMYFNNLKVGQTWKDQFSSLLELIETEEPNYTSRESARIAGILYDEMEQRQMPPADKRNYLTSGIVSFYKDRPEENNQKVMFDTNRLFLNTIHAYDSLIFMFNVNFTPVFAVAKLHHSGNFRVFEMLHPYIPETVEIKDLQLVLRFFLIKFAVQFSEQLNISWIVEAGSNDDILKILVNQMGFDLYQRDSMEVDTDDYTHYERTDPHKYLENVVKIKLQNHENNLCILRKENYQDRLFNNIQKSLNDCMLDTHQYKLPTQTKIRIAQKAHTCAECNEPILEGDKYIKKRIQENLYQRHCIKH